LVTTTPVRPIVIGRDDDGIRSFRRGWEYPLRSAATDRDNGGVPSAARDQGGDGPGRRSSLQTIENRGGLLAIIIENRDRRFIKVFRKQIDIIDPPAAAAAFGPKTINPEFLSGEANVLETR